MADDATGTRINRFLSEAGFGSRRACEEIVRAGRVQIDGDTVTSLAARVLENSVVRVDGNEVARQVRTHVIALNKPARVLVSNRDDEGRKLAIDFVRPAISGRLMYIGRLDYLTTGLILFTNDGELSRRLTSPDAAIEREYTVETREPIDDSLLTAFSRGVEIDGVPYRLAHFQRHSARRLTLVLREGRNREIRRVFDHFGVRVTRIHRTRFGPIRVGAIPSGGYRMLNRNEVDRLWKAVR